MRDCDALLEEIVEQALRVGIPVSPKLDPRVRINDRAVSRFGACKYQNGRYYIELARRIAEGPEESCRSVLAHEVLHTCWGCRNHGKRWRSYGQKMKAAYGYDICRASTNEAMGVGEVRQYRYLLQCEKCGAEFGRFRASSLVRSPRKYRCKCGGEILRVK